MAAAVQLPSPLPKLHQVAGHENRQWPVFVEPVTQNEPQVLSEPCRRPGDGVHRPRQVEKSLTIRCVLWKGTFEAELDEASKAEIVRDESLQAETLGFSLQPSILPSFCASTLPSFPSTPPFPHPSIPSGTGQSNGTHKEGTKKERKQKARLLKQSLEREQAKQYRAWVRQTKVQEKERKKEEEKEEKMRRTRVDTKCHAKPVWCWALWWCLVLSLVGGVEAHGFFGGCLVGLWTCIPLVGMLALMAPKKGKKKSHEGEGEEGEEGEEAGGGAAASVRSRSPRNRAKARRRSRGSKAEEVGEGEEEGGGAAVSGSAKRCHALCWAGNRCDGDKGWRNKLLQKPYEGPASWHSRGQQ
eukprot:symbB.v1.2.032910.t1/scaffold4021.1/size46230/1